MSAARRRRAALNAILALTALLVGGGLIVTARRPAPPPPGPTDAEIQAVVAELDASTREAAAGAATRAATLAEIPRLAVAVATDAATVRDLTAEELSFRPREGETIEIGQVPHEGAPVSLLRLPSGAPFGAPLATPGTSLVSTAGQLLVCSVVSVQPRQRADEMTGAVAVTYQLDLHPVITRLDRLGIGARVIVPGGAPVTLGATPLPPGAPTRELALTHKAGGGARVAVPVVARAATGSILDARRVSVGAILAASGLAVAAMLSLRGRARSRAPDAAVRAAHERPTAPNGHLLVTDDARPTPTAVDVPRPPAGELPRPTPVASPQPLAWERPGEHTNPYGRRDGLSPVPSVISAIPPLVEVPDGAPASQEAAASSAPAGATGRKPIGIPRTNPGMPVLPTPVPLPVPPPASPPPRKRGGTPPFPPLQTPMPGLTPTPALTAAPRPAPPASRAPAAAGPGLPPPPRSTAAPTPQVLASLDLPVPQPEEFSVYEAATPVRNVLELRGVLSAAAPPRIDPGLPGAPPPPLTREECENVFREYIELRRFYADRSEAMPFSHFAELLKRQRAQLLREGHPMVRFEVYRGGDGKIAVKGIGRSK